MRKFFTLVSFFFFASLGSATILGPLSQQYPGYCTGANSPACPGSIEVLQPSDPGTLWATGSSIIQDFGQPGLPAIGKLTSAAFRQDEGVAAYTFYYQLTMYNTDLYPIKLLGLDVFSGWDSRRAISFADVAVRTDGLGTIGDVNFVASSLLPSSISVSPGFYNNLDIDFNSPNVAPGATTATIVIRTDSPAFMVNAGGLVAANFQPMYAFGIYGDLYGNTVVAPQVAPGPASFLLLGAGLSLFVAVPRLRRRGRLGRSTDIARLSMLR